MFYVVMAMQAMLLMVQSFFLGYDQAILEKTESDSSQIYLHSRLMFRIVSVETVLVAALLALVWVTDGFQPIMICSPLLSFASDVVHLIYLFRVLKKTKP